MYVAGCCSPRPSIFVQHYSRCQFTAWVGASQASEVLAIDSANVKALFRRGSARMAHDGDVKGALKDFVACSKADPSNKYVFGPTVCVCACVRACVRAHGLAPSDMCAVCCQAGPQVCGQVQEAVAGAEGKAKEGFWRHVQDQHVR